MGKVTGFMEIAREERQYLPVDRRLKDFGEFTVNLSDAQLAAQGARCMDCGIPYCHTAYGCPLANLIPDWNDLVYRGEWRAALRPRPAIRRDKPSRSSPESSSPAGSRRRCGSRECRSPCTARPAPPTARRSS